MKWRTVRNYPNTDDCQAKRNLTSLTGFVCLFRLEALSSARDCVAHRSVALGCGFGSLKTDCYVDGSSVPQFTTASWSVGRSLSFSLAVRRSVGRQVKGSEQALAEARLLLFECGRVTLNNGMRLLGLVPVERM